ncbi:hypothetical protein FTUN_8496 [Frigoriglobus tundricola]|uniref:Uncharacterized protein n=1 Tax=Frigoriglobus tundricola TaxID=2774151 RepID=A0A6M5Z362_9BACT|nr:hypothetical protein FTUN_8496 [Frigoriglobus tundricola]
MLVTYGYPDRDTVLSGRSRGGALLNWVNTSRLLPALRSL